MILLSHNQYFQVFQRNPKHFFLSVMSPNGIPDQGFPNCGLRTQLGCYVIITVSGICAYETVFQTGFVIVKLLLVIANLG